MVKLLIRAYEDAKAQAAAGAPAEEVLRRITHLGLVGLAGGLSPRELREIAARLAEGARRSRGEGGTGKHGL